MEAREIFDWVELWFEPTFGEAEAGALFGVAHDPEANFARATPASSRFKDVVFERTGRPPGFLSGVQLTLAQPEGVSWDEVVKRYGEPRLLGVPWDHWGAPAMYGFKLAEKGQKGQLILSSQGKPEASAVITGLTIRRYPPSMEAKRAEPSPTE